MQGVQYKIENACAKVGRKASEITLVAVSKKQPIQNVQSYLDIYSQKNLNTVLGENYVQEIKKRKQELQGPYSMHLIGHLQKNKAKDAVRLCDVIESVDSPELVGILDVEAGKVGKIQEVFLQVNISKDTLKSGFSPEMLQTFFAEDPSRFKNLKINGLMTITKLYAQAEQVRPDFSALRDLRDKLSYDKALHLSMGMSSDFEIAIEEGATFIRVGSAIFGERAERSP